MNWPDDVVSKVGKAIHKSMMTARIWVSVNGESWESSKPEAQAALSAITLHDIAKLPEVRALLEATDATVERWDGPLWKDLPNTAVYIHKLRKALEPFTEVSNA